MLPAVPAFVVIVAVKAFIVETAATALRFTVVGFGLAATGIAHFSCPTREAVDAGTSTGFVVIAGCTLVIEAAARALGGTVVGAGLAFATNAL